MERGRYFTRRNFLKVGCLAIGASIIGQRFRGLEELVQADEPIIFQASSARVISISAEEIREAAISRFGKVWEEESNIWYATLADPNNLFLLTTSGDAHQPDIEGEEAVYVEAGSVFKHNLTTDEKKIIYNAAPGEICSNPRIKGEYLIFSFLKDDHTEIWSCKHGDRRPRFNTITNSNNPKKSADTNGRYVIWAERNDKLISRPGLPNGDWDIRIYDLETGKPSIFDPNLRAEISVLDGDPNYPLVGDPNFSSDSCAINTRYAAFNLNTFDPTDPNKNIQDIDTFLGTYCFDNGRRRRSDPGVQGAIRELDMAGGLLTWERQYCPGSNPPNEPNRIEYLVLKEERSPGFRLFDSGGHQHRPDAYMDPNGTIAMIIYTESDPNVSDPPAGRTLTMSMSAAASSSTILAHPYTILSSQLERIDNPDQMLNPFFANWLRKNTPPDCHIDGINNFKDFAILAQKWQEHRRSLRE